MGGGEAGFLSMMIENLNICSYYTGLPEEGRDQFYIALILESSEDPSLYEEGLVESVYEIIEQRKKPNFVNILRNYLQKMPKFLSLTDEQRFSFIFKNPTRVLILRKLTEGAIIKEVLRKWLSDRVGYDILDLDGLLMPFIKTNILKEFKIPTEISAETECLFLIKDVFFMRTPAEKMMKKYGKKSKSKTAIFKNYKDEVHRFFKKYKLEERDSRECSQFFSDPDFYSVITALRDDGQELESLIKNVKLDANMVNSIIKNLRNAKMVKEIKDSNGKKIIYLLNDIAYPTFFPEYMIDSIRRRWGERNISQTLALQHLQLLKGIFQGLSPEVAMFGTRAAMLMKKEEEELVEKAKAEIKIKVPAKVEIKKKPAVKPTPKKIKPKPKPKLPRVVKPALDRKQIAQLKKDQKEELVKVKRAIKNKLFDVALAPLERAKKIGNQLVEIKEEGAEEELQKIILLEQEIHKKLKIKKTDKIKVKPEKKEEIKLTEEEKTSLREERKKVMNDADTAIDKEDFEKAIRALERAAMISEQLGEIKLADEIWGKIKTIKRSLKSLSK
ncbi:MAG: hypothetical protein ACTSRG_05345 [Candidatus Helarchaeota archaeon]